MAAVRTSHFESEYVILPEIVVVAAFHQYVLHQQIFRSTSQKLPSLRISPYLRLILLSALWYRIAVRFFVDRFKMVTRPLSLWVGKRSA